jgi:DNA-binding transcriptional LysR family regulator
MMDVSKRIVRRLKLHDLRILMSVAEAGSMSKAAKLMATSQPAISRTIPDLEHSLGVRLFDRGPQGIFPTPYGEALLKRSVAVFDELRLGVRDVQSLVDPTAGEVRIAATVGPAIGFVPEVIDRVGRRYPRIVCRLTTGEHEGIFRKLEDREADLAIVFLTSAVDRSRMEAEALFHAGPAVVVASANNALSRRRNVTLSDLIDHPWALPEPEGLFGYNHIFHAAGLKPPNLAVIADSIPIRLALAARGRFVTMMPEPILRLSGRGMALKILPIPTVPGRYDIGFVTLKNRTLTSAVEIFIGYCREVAKDVKAGKPLGLRRLGATR